MWRKLGPVLEVRPCKSAPNSTSCDLQEVSNIVNLSHNKDAEVIYLKEVITDCCHNMPLGTV